jgi:hypothetical protein
MQAQAFRTLADTSNALHLLQRYEVMFRRQYERALRMLWEHRDRQRELSAPATPSKPQDRNFTKRTETRPAETEPRGSSPKGCDRAVQTQPSQPSDTPHRARVNPPPFTAICAQAAGASRTARLFVRALPGRSP